MPVNARLANTALIWLFAAFLVFLIAMYFALFGPPLEAARRR